MNKSMNEYNNVNYYIAAELNVWQITVRKFIYWNHISRNSSGKYAAIWCIYIKAIILFY